MSQTSTQTNVAEIIRDYEQDGVASCVVNAPLDVGIELLGRQNFRLITMSENAELRLNDVPNSSIREFGNFVDAWVLYCPESWLSHETGGKQFGLDGKIKNFMGVGAKIPIADAMAQFRTGVGVEYYPDDEPLRKILHSALPFPNVSIPTSGGSSEPLIGVPELIVGTIGDGDKEKALKYETLNKSRGAGTIHLWPLPSDYVNAHNETEDPKTKQKVKSPVHQRPFVRPVYFSGVQYCSLIDATRRPERAVRVRGIGHY